ncbi:hypothetical protein M758_12G081000 [Ceratodon purpureus]|nr:hypothetical protein M758_12G081000 [Ceratodon purpureus]
MSSKQDCWQCVVGNQFSKVEGRGSIFGTAVVNYKPRPKGTWWLQSSCRRTIAG